MYKIVAFGNQSIEMAPQNWLRKENKKIFCLWPQYGPRELSAAVKNRHEALTSWQTCEVVRVLYENDSYEKTRLKLRRAEDTSDLDTTDVEVSKKRRRKPTVRFCDSESDLDEGKSTRKKSRMSEPISSTPTKKGLPQSVSSYSSSESEKEENDLSLSERAVSGPSHSKRSDGRTDFSSLQTDILQDVSVIDEDMSLSRFEIKGLLQKALAGIEVLKMQQANTHMLVDSLVKAQDDRQQCLSEPPSDLVLPLNFYYYAFSK